MWAPGILKRDIHRNASMMTPELPMDLVTMDMSA